MRKLASIQKIKFVRPIPDADMIVCVGVLGWELVAMKDEFKEGDWCIYFEIDSLLPVHPIYEFLRKSSWNPRYEMFRLKTAVRRKQISQGLALPLSALEALNVSCPIEEGFDLTEKLGVIKYEQLIPVELQGQARPFAWPISITDEIRVQSFPDFIQKLWGKPYYISIKLDGTSTTFAYVNKEFHACGHNYSYLEDEFNTFWKIANRYDLPAIFPAYCEHESISAG
jgi:RNA ligase (TIGR02306 family)